MFKARLSLIILALFIPGCFATMPPQLDDKLIAGKGSDDQKARILKLEEEIVAINRDKLAIENRLKISEQKVVISKKVSAAIVAGSDVLEEEKRLYMITDDRKALDDNAKNMKMNIEQGKLEALNTEYLKAMVEDEKALIDCKDALLSVKVAERELEKAKILRADQDRIAAPAASDPKEAQKADKDKVNLAEYEGYLAKQKDILGKREQEQKKTAELLKQAEARLRESGYKMEK